MARLLFIVEQAIPAKDGLTLLPGIPLRDSRPDLQAIVQGMELELRRPDGACRRACLARYTVSTYRDEDGAFFVFGESQPQMIHFTLEGITPDDAPPGAEVWLPGAD